MVRPHCAPQCRRGDHRKARETQNSQISQQVLVDCEWCQFYGDEIVRDQIGRIKVLVEMSRGGILVQEFQRNAPNFVRHLTNESVHITAIQVRQLEIGGIDSNQCNVPEPILINELFPSWITHWRLIHEDHASWIQRGKLTHLFDPVPIQCHRIEGRR